MTPPRTLLQGTGVLGIAIASVAAITSCTSSSATTASDTPRDDTISYVHAQEPPCIWGSWVQAAYTSRQVFDSLVSWDDDHPVPWLAKDWEVSPDGKDITFSLRDDVTFTDGTEFNAAAVVANTDYWVENLGWNSFSYLEGASENEEYNVTLHLSEPNPGIFRVLSNGHYGIQSPTALENNSEAENCQYPVGSGPWKVDDWSQGQKILFERNDEYSSAPTNVMNQGPPHEKYLEWKFAPDANTRWSALTSGEADAVYDPPASQWGTAEEDYQVHSYITGGRQQAFSFNVEQGPFTDVRVRQAFAHATDRKRITETVFKGSAPYEANGSLSPANPYYLDVNDSYGFDPERAGELLDDAGWKLNDDGVREKNGETLHIRLPFGSDAIVGQDGTAALQAVKEQADQVGFDLELIPLTQTQHFAGEKQGADEAELIFGYWVWPSPNILDIVYNAGTEEEPNGNNKSHFSNPEVEERIMAAQRETDPSVREDRYHVLLSFFNDVALAVGFFDFTNMVVTQKDLEGFKQDQGSNGMPIFNDVTLEDG
ncbi:MAG: ABC transporter substrate-binding protein [Mycobacteriaceae bacterium]